MIDSHAHLIWDSYDGDRPEVLQRALASGVHDIVHPCVLPADFPRMREIRDSHPEMRIHLAAGVHPCYGEQSSPADEDLIRELSGDMVAIGECGLDAYHRDVPMDRQEEIFRMQCRLARELDKPVIVHCRDAFEDTYRVLSEENPGRGVMHCFTGDSSWAQKFWELGFYVSFAGVLTFRKSHELRQEASQIPLERTLIETDSPFLAPQAYRGQRNEPGYVREVCRVLAEVHGKDMESVDRITTANVEALFELN